MWENSLIIVSGFSSALGAGVRSGSRILGLQFFNPLFFLKLEGVLFKLGVGNGRVHVSLELYVRNGQVEVLGRVAVVVFAGDLAQRNLNQGVLIIYHKLLIVLGLLTNDQLGWEVRDHF